MARYRDVQAFDDRSRDYESGRHGELHHRIAEATADIAMAGVAAPSHILDVGCGTGYLLRLLAVRCPEAIELVGIDPAPGMIEVAKSAADDQRLRFTSGVAEMLPYPESSFDLVVTTTSFDHWADQRAGLAECARVMAPGGRFVLTDLFSVIFLPTLLVGHRGRARTPRRAGSLLRAVGFVSITWHRLPPPLTTLIRTVTATK
jgi:ubiquinone/menaquinone biosynthesis C-methylase UbiE